MEKKRVIKSLENLDPSIKHLLKSEYPYGFEESLTKLTNAKNEPFYVVPLETDDTAYLIKISVTRNEEGDVDVDIDQEAFDRNDIVLDDDDEPEESGEAEEEDD